MCRHQGVLPPAFFTPNEHNVRGGVEFSFMSCSKSRGVAMQYATHKGEDRGAALGRSKPRTV